MKDDDDEEERTRGGVFPSRQATAYSARASAVRKLFVVTTLPRKTMEWFFASDDGTMALYNRKGGMLWRSILVFMWMSENWKTGEDSCVFGRF